MRLNISNFGKIESADLEFKGLTVVVGDNNTGKSTVGRVLFSFFDVYSSIDERVRAARYQYVVNAGRLPFLRHLDVNALLEDVSLDEDSLLNLFKANPESFRPWRMVNENDKSPEAISKEDSWYRQLAKDVLARIVSCRKLPDRQLALMEIVNGFGYYFNDPVSFVLDHGEKDTELVLAVKNQEIKLAIRGNQVTSDTGVSLIHRAWFVGSPALLNAVSKGITDDYMERAHNPLLKKLREQIGNAVTVAVVSEKLRPILKRILEILPGQFEVAPAGHSLLIKSREFSNGLPVESLSMGLKAFAVLRLMLERGVLQDEDVLVLDEPENHLHPRWQLVYAEIIVLLQQAFNLTVFLSTHSPYFMDAIRLYSAKYGTKDNLRVYQPDVVGTKTSFPGSQNIAEDKAVLYKPFSSPLRDLRDLAAEVE